MKQNIFKFTFVFLLFLTYCVQEAKAESIVYFFFDFRFTNKEYTFNVNGEKGFTLSTNIAKYESIWNMMARKIIFRESGSYVVDVDCPHDMRHCVYHASINLNLEDGETYYVLINNTLTKTFYMELLNDSKGKKMLNKARTSKKYTFNEDYIYTGN